MKPDECIFDMRKEAVYPFDFLQADRVLRPNRLDTYRFSTVISLPKIRDSRGRVVRGFIRKFYAWEDLRVKEEGVGINSSP
jgi:hypothetical protein